MSFKLQRILILDIKSIIPVNLDIFGFYFIQVQVTKIKKFNDIKDKQNKIYLQAFKSKKYKKKKFNFFANPILEEEVINLKNSFFIPIEIDKFNEKENKIDVYLVFKFLENHENEDFDTLKVDFNLVSNDIEDNSILNSASYIIDYENRVFAEYSPVNFYDFYFFELKVFFYSFVKEIKIYDKKKENLKDKISILKLKNLNNEIFKIKDISNIMQTNSKSFENSKLILDKSYRFLKQFLTSNLDIFSDKNILINEPLKTMRIDNIFKNKNTSETFKKNIEKIHQELNKTQENILKTIPDFLKYLQKSDENYNILQYMKNIYSKKSIINLNKTIISIKKQNFEISQQWHNKELLSKTNLKIKNLPIQNSYIKDQINSIHKLYEEIYLKKTKKKFEKGKHVFIFFHGFYGSIWDLQFVKFHIKLINPEAIFYSVSSIEDKTNGIIIRMFKSYG